MRIRKSADGAWIWVCDNAHCRAPVHQGHGVHEDFETARKTAVDHNDTWHLPVRVVGHDLYMANA